MDIKRFIDQKPFEYQMLSPLKLQDFVSIPGHYVKMFLFCFITNDQRDNAR